MKKKFLSFVLAICLILPCAFALSACGKNPQPGGPVDLAGKTIVVQYGSGELDWNNVIPITSKLENYSTEMTLKDFVEKYYTEYRPAIEGLAHNSNINTIEEAKTAIRDWAVGTILSRNPIIKFSEDGSTATTYAENDINLETPLKTYTVQKSGTDELFVYDLYEGQDFKIKVTCDYDSIDVTNGAEELCFNTTFNLGSYSSATILLYDNEENEKEFRFDQCEFAYGATELKLWLKNYVLSYKVK